MTWTTELDGALDRACRVLLHAIVRGLALTRISPNVLTFMGLVINMIAAILFGYANGDQHSAHVSLCRPGDYWSGNLRHGRWPRGPGHRTSHNFWRIL